MELLTHGVQAYREGESRATFATVGEIARARDKILHGAYLLYNGRPTPRYASVMAGISPNAQDLLEAAETAADAIRNDRFVQLQADTVTWQDSVNDAIAILMAEVGETGGSQRGDAFQRARGSLQQKPPFYATRGCG